MKIKIATDDPQSMAQDGASILRSLQNKSIPLIDLIVRESIQNSLDAGIDQLGHTKVDFYFGDFDSVELAKIMEGISEKLLQNYCDKTKFLAITDKNTVGLTGAISGGTDDLVNSNFHKLVFGIGKNQEKEGAGGSWGLGKTSYFRIGNGLVLYYTRIKTEDSYEERLIASLIESNKLEDRLLPHSDRGIAWWGKEIYNGQIFPVTDTEEIKEILNIFSLRPYQGDETGTTILIPYLRNEDLLEERNEEPYYWTKDIESSIKMSVLRWYFPRLLNNIYKMNFNSNMLSCSVNGEDVKVENEAVFNIFQDLYNSALLGNPTNEDIVVHPIILKRKAGEDVKKPLGFVSYINASEEMLDMCPPNNCPSPLAYLGKNFNFESLTECKVAAYCRKPGMVVEYDIDNTWLPATQILKEKHIMLSMFVPVSKAKLSQGSYEDYPTIEAYLRSVENADHANWTDESGYTLIKRLKREVRSSVANDFAENEISTIGNETSRLSKILGKSLLPPTGYGKNSSPETVNQRGKSRKVGFKSSVSIISVNIVDEQYVKLKVKGRIPKGHNAKLKLIVETQDGHVDYCKWKDDFAEIPFPFSIKSIKDLSNTFFEDLNDCVKNEEILLPLSEGDVGFELEMVIFKSSNQYLPMLIITQ